MISQSEVFVGFNTYILCSLVIKSIPSWTSMRTQLYKERVLAVVICSVLINICTWLPLSLFLGPPALSPLHLRTFAHREKQRSSTASASTEVVAQLLCFVLFFFFAREKRGVFPQGETLFSSFCCLWSPPVVYMVKISGTYNPATVRS